MTLLHLSPPESFFLAPLCSTAVLLLATGRSWRARRLWCDCIGLGAGVFTLGFFLSALPPRLFVVALPAASLGVAFAVFALNAWRFAPDFGQTGVRWLLSLAARPTLGCALGATAPFACLLAWPQHRALSFACTVATASGLIVAHLFDHAICNHALSFPTPPRADDDGGNPALTPDIIHQ